MEPSYIPAPEAYLLVMLRHYLNRSRDRFAAWTNLVRAL
jgi:hypothetical protein